MEPQEVLAISHLGNMWILCFAILVAFVLHQYLFFGPVLRMNCGTRLVEVETFGHWISFPLAMQKVKCQVWEFSQLGHTLFLATGFIPP